jgi:hypothetical protein
MKFIPRYYTIDKLSPAGLWLISDRLKSLLREYNISMLPMRGIVNSAGREQNIPAGRYSANGRMSVMSTYGR